MSIEIIIPAYREADNLKKIIKKLNQNIQGTSITIVDDTPEKDMSKILEHFSNVNYIYRGEKLGRGSAVLVGMRESLKKKSSKIFIEMDSDFSHDPDELENNINFFKKKSNCDLLISSRYLKDSKIIKWSIQRFIFSYFANKLAKFLLKVPVSDYTNGYRIYSKRAAMHIVNNCGKIGEGFIILSECLVELYYNKFVISEVPTIFRNRVRGLSSVNLNEIINSFFGLIKIYKLKKKLVKKFSLN